MRMNVKVEPAKQNPVLPRSIDDLTTGLYQDADDDYIIIPDGGPEEAICISENGHHVFAWPITKAHSSSRWENLVKVTSPLVITLSFNGAPQ